MNPREISTNLDESTSKFREFVTPHVILGTLWDNSLVAS
jgi:hypothetical protein